jgi:hypothetical protein
LIEDFNIYIVMLDPKDPPVADPGEESHPIDLSGERDSPVPATINGKYVRTYATPLRSSKRQRGGNAVARKRGSIRLDKSDTVLSVKQKVGLHRAEASEHHP